MSKSIDPKKLGDYVIIDEISRGAMGIVYRAEKSGNVYALKLLRATDVNSAVRFRKETVSIARLNHPSLVRIVDANEFEGTQFIVMEYLDGANLGVVLQSGKLERSMFLKVATSITSALSEMHKYSMVHRDIKASNIIVTQAQEVKLLDLGLAGDSHDLISEDARDVVGTILYASPEQLRVLKRPVDGRSDLYSLGITLYESLAGACPFEHENIAELMKMHAAVPAPDIRIKAPDTSPVIAAIIGKLLEKDPDDRYQSAEGLKFDLENIRKLEDEFKSAGKVSLGARDRLLQGSSELPLAGRKNELELLNHYWQESSSGKGCAVIIEGEGGSGKSRLTQELITQASQKSIWLLKGKCQTHASRLPYAPIREAFDSFLSSISLLSESDQKIWHDKIRKASLHAPDAIRELSSGFKNVLGAAKQRAAFTQDDSDRQRFHEDLVTFFKNLVDVSPGIIFLIDDIQWLDTSSNDLLCSLCSQVGGMKLLLLMTSRNDQASERVLAHFKERNASALMPSMALRPLNEQDVEEIVFAQLGTDSLDRTAVRRLATAANGNPFVVTEYIRGLLNSGHLFYQESRWQINAEGIAAISLSNNVFQLVLDRINSLSLTVKEVLTVAAVVGNIFDLDALIGAAGLGDDDVLLGIQIALQNNFITALEGKKYRFGHDRIREALVQGVSPESLREINDRLAIYADKDTSNKSWFDVARFYANGNADLHVKRTSETNHEAGKIALSNFAYQQAFELFEIALRYAQKGDLGSQTIRTIAKNLAIAAGESGHEKKAYESIEIALGFANTIPERVDFLYVKMKAYFNFGRLNLAWVTFKQILDLEGRPYPRYGLFRWIQISWLLFAFTMRMLFGFKRPMKESPRRQKVESLSAIYLVGSHTARIRAGNDSLWIALEMCNLSFSLGPSVQFARSICHLSTIFCNYRLKNVGTYLIDLAYSMVPASDEATIAYIKYFEMMTLVNLDDNRFDTHHAEIGPAITKYLGPYEFSGWSNYRSLRYFHKGMHREALGNIQQHLPKLETLGNKLFIANTLGEMPFHLAQLGDPEGSLECRKQLMKIIDSDLKDEWASIAQYVHSELYFAYEEGDVNTDTDLQIDSVRDFHWAFITNRLNFSNIAYIRLAQLERAVTYEEKRRARILLKETLHSYFFKAFGPTAEAHFYIVKSGFLRCEGRHRAALAMIEKGYAIARQAESPLLLFRAIRERAKIYKAADDMLRVQGESVVLESLATQHGWAMRAAQVQKEFGTEVSLGSNRFESHADRTIVRTRTSNMTLMRPHLSSSRVIDTTLHGTVARGSGPMSSTVQSQSVTKEERALAALTQVAQASTFSIDPVEQAHSVLSEIVKLFGAERAFLFLAEDELPAPPTEALKEKLDEVS